ncbi:type VI secretion system baseplate subunit TssF [Paralimibaculum aggregatum]|uniref:Type VI secretion system baseplate subunit TssF n=1 Tax=Paralimibaculum aggregatum TaxID=3036245 RepID=A0ABQ6LLA8_9RHOB|nr:type VI secretion system baseplate subunit TssF [Limibaculum sp. NKW23]GMG81608.1 type VI secretion system baseplate subunit TssF [Limibaculum sp. NKW23]
MDTRLLKHYEDELAFIREMGAEFAASYPKIASRLGMEGLEVFDPYVERMLEGFAFLAARVQLELSLQYPTFTQHLLEIVYPHYTAPTPSMMVVKLIPDQAQGGLEAGFRVPAGSRLRSPLRDGEVTTPCVFRTAHDVTLWPIRISEAEYIDGRGALVAAGLGEEEDARAAIRLRLQHTDGEPISSLELDRLTLFLSGSGPEPWRLYETMSRDTVGLYARSTVRRNDWVQRLGDRPVTPIGFEPEEALLPYPGQSFDGYRLLQEYFAMPQRFFFMRLSELRAGVARADAPEMDLYVLLSDTMSELRDAVQPSNFELFATPAINLFDKRCDRVHLRERDNECHVVPDRTSPLDFEIHHLKKVIGVSDQGEEDLEFRPFYSTDDITAAGDSHEAYYAAKRRMRQRSEKQRLKGARTSYLGSEIFLSLVDPNNAPYPKGIDQLAVTAVCTNRDLPLILSIGGGKTDFYMPDGGPVSEVRAVVSPTRPRQSLAQGDSAWRIISHLSLNYLSIADTDRGGGGQALREMLAIYSPLGDRAINKQLEGVVGVGSKPIVRRMRDTVLSTAVRGIEVTVEFDESAFEGSSCYLLGAVLERFFAKYVALNSFTETVIRSQDRGEIARWQARSGGRLLI